MTLTHSSRTKNRHDVNSNFEVEMRSSSRPGVPTTISTWKTKIIFSSLMKPLSVLFWKTQVIIQPEGTSVLERYECAWKTFPNCYIVSTASSNPNPITLPYSSGAQRPARRPRPARDESSCGSRCPTRKVTSLAQTFSLQFEFHKNSTWNQPTTIFSLTSRNLL